MFLSKQSTDSKQGRFAAVETFNALWKETRLRVENARPRQKNASLPLPAAPVEELLLDILLVGCGEKDEYVYSSGVCSRLAKRTTPSAGGLYPFEIIVGMVSAGDSPWSGNYLYDVNNKSLIHLPAKTLSPRDLVELYLKAPGELETDVVVLFLARPWLSMRKYGLRGYAYCHLDIGHAATNLAVYALALGYSPGIHLRFQHQKLIAKMELQNLCREPIAVVTLKGVRKKSDLVISRIGGDNASTGKLDLPAVEEVENWNRIKAAISQSVVLPLPACVPDHNPLRDVGDNPLQKPVAMTSPGDSASFKQPDDIRWAIMGRRSAKDFHEQPLALSKVSELLGALNLNLPVDCPAKGQMGITAYLLSRNIGNLESGVYGYSRTRAALQKIAAATETIDFQSACMGQAVVRHAAALILFCAPVRDLLTKRGYAGFTELHFHAAQLGQSLCLAASKFNVGITCIGGFDENLCARLARLKGREEVIYVLALGVARHTTTKHDALPVAYSHGFLSLAGEQPHEHNT